jgi:integrase
MPSKLTKTSVPGIYRRHAKGCDRHGRCECAYVVIYDGRTRTFPTLDEAREGKRLAQRQARLAKAHRKGVHADDPKDECRLCLEDQGERERRRDARPLLHTYAREWIERYQGNGRRGFREESRAEYRTLLNAYALRFFPPGTRLEDVRPKQVSEFIAWLVEQPGRNGRTLSDKTVRNALGPVRACMATAKREGDIPDNPVVGAALPHRPGIEDDENLPRPFPRIDGEETMELVVELVHPGHRTMFALLAATGVRRSELLALQVRHLDLSGRIPKVLVRQRARAQKGRGQVIGPLKSPHARRDLPIPLDLADRLFRHVAGKRPDEPCFPSPFGGGPYDPAHLYTRVLAPACQEAGVGWAGFHTFRHTVASRMFAAGRTAVQVQHWLGHHSAAFTLRTYVHLLDQDDLGGPLEPVRVKKNTMEGPETAANGRTGAIGETRRLQA